MTSPKQDERPKTLIEYMGFKDPDLKDFTHDEWCLKLLNEKLLMKILKKKVLNKLKNGRIEVYEFQDRNNVTHYVDDNRLCDGEFKRFEVDFEWEFFIDENIPLKIELEHVITKYGNNGYSQRMGFIDVFFKISLILKKIAVINNEKKCLNYINGSDKFVLFFEVKTSKQTIGAIVREIEYYRNVLEETERSKYLFPFLVAKEKLPITQFETITFDEILQLEKEIEQEKQ